MKTDREYKLSYTNKYYNKLPGNYTPAEMKALINYKKLSPIDLTATIINLIIHEYIYVQEIKNKDAFLLSKQNDYLLKLNDKKDVKSLLSHEIIIINWCFEKIGNGKEVKISSIKDYTRKNSSALIFNQNYILWCKSVLSDCNKNNFFKPKGITNIIGISISILYLVIALLFSIKYQKYVYLFLIFLSFITFIYTLNIIKMTEYGQKQYELIMAFKRYIKDLGKSEQLQCSIEECEKYMPYAISLGISNYLIEYMISILDNSENVTIFKNINIFEFKELITKINKNFEISANAVTFVKKNKYS